MGIYDASRGVFRRKNSQFQKKGVSDILGIFRGRPLAIEVKSAKGKTSDDQREFLLNFELQGGIAFVARSVEDVARELGF